MKEITRIHIAKISYDAEVVAKKELETYLKTLEAYGTDTDIIDDIEIRITEILSERGVKKNGVIAEADVKALKQQLGDPSEFMGDGDIALGPDDGDVKNEPTKKLYRNTDNAVLGGVLSGIAAFFNISPLLIRLLFVIVALASFGTAILVYVVLWIAVPPAKTAADKLQMTGRPVTVSSIRQMNEREIKTDAGSGEGRRVGLVLAGVGAVLGAVGAAVLTTFGAFAMIISGRDTLFDVVINSGPLLAAYILAIVSGLLLMTLFILLAYAAFSQKMTHRVLVSLCVVVVLGLGTFGTAIGLTQYGGRQINRVIEANTRETTVQLPSGASTATALAVSAKRLNVKYIVSTDTHAATLSAVAKDVASMPKVTVTLQEGVLKVDAPDVPRDASCTGLWGCGPEPTLTLYGPALKQLTGSEEVSIDYQATSQHDIALTAQKNARIAVASGTVDTVHVEAGDNSEVVTSQATIAHVIVAVKSSVNVEIGTVQSLVVSDQKSCPARSHSRVEVWKVSDSTIMLNGAVTPVKSVNMDCTNILIESEDN